VIYERNLRRNIWIRKSSVAVGHKPRGIERRCGQSVVQQHASSDVKDAEADDDG